MNEFPVVKKEECKVVYQDYACPWGGSYTIYAVPISSLHLNKDNGRIASWVSGYVNNPNVKPFEDMSLKEWNDALSQFVSDSSSSEENAKTKESLKKYGQLKVGAILPDGTVVAGNRRCSLLMELIKENPDNEAYRYFNCAIFEYPNSDEGRKALKRLETATQYGEDSPVSYGPIEKLVDIYNNVIIDNAPYSVDDYQHFLNIGKTEIRNLVIRAEILVDYLSFIKKPGNYEAARTAKLDGPINELCGLYKKVGVSKWNDIKSVFYQSMGNNKKRDKTRAIRSLIKAYVTNPEGFSVVKEKADEDLLANDKESFNGNEPSVIQQVARQEGFSKTIDGYIAESQINGARRKPIDKVQSAIESIQKIDVDAINVLSEEERKSFFKKLSYLEHLVSDMGKDCHK